MFPCTPQSEIDVDLVFPLSLKVGKYLYKGRQVRLYSNNNSNNTNNNNNKRSKIRKNTAEGDQNQLVVVFRRFLNRSTRRVIDKEVW